MCELHQYVDPKGMLAKSDDIRNLSETFVVDFTSVLDGQVATFASVELERSPKADGGHVHPGAAKVPGRRFAIIGSFRANSIEPVPIHDDHYQAFGAFGNGGSYNNFN